MPFAGLINRNSLSLLCYWCFQSIRTNDRADRIDKQTDIGCLPARPAFLKLGQLHAHNTAFGKHGAGSVQIGILQAIRHLIFSRDQSRFQHVAIDMDIHVASGDRLAKPLRQRRTDVDQLKHARIDKALFAWIEIATADQDNIAESKSGTQPRVSLASGTRQHDAAKIAGCRVFGYVTVAVCIEPTTAAAGYRRATTGSVASEAEQRPITVTVRCLPCMAASSVNANWSSPGVAAESSIDQSTPSGVSGVPIRRIEAPIAVASAAPSSSTPAIASGLLSPTRPANIVT